MMVVNNFIGNFVKYLKKDEIKSRNIETFKLSPLKSKVFNSSNYPFSGKELWFKNMKKSDFLTTIDLSLWSLESIFFSMSLCLIWQLYDVIRQLMI